jgi:uncharacterized caspase-like protein
VKGTNYLLPVDARLESERDVGLEAISLDQAINAVEGARKLRLILLDACRNNPFAGRMKGRAARRAVEVGLADVNPKPGTVVVYAAKHGKVALDGEGGINSPFASALAKYLPMPGVEIDKLFRMVRDDVAATTNGEQEPWAYYGQRTGGDFFFVSSN